MIIVNVFMLMFFNQFNNILFIMLSKTFESVCMQFCGFECNNRILRIVFMPLNCKNQD